MRARGYSLLELMIAITIGLFLIGGLLTLTNAMKRTTRIEDNLTLLQDNERLAINLMSDVIQVAGYFPSPVGGKTARSEFGAIAANQNNTTAGGLAMSAGQTILGAPGPSGADAVTVRYESSGTDNVLNCAGQGYTAAVGIISTFQLDGAGNLDCYTTTYTPPATGFTAPALSVLVGGGQSGVQNLGIAYGVQSNPNSGTTSIDAYLTAAAVTANNLWNSVYSVRITYTMLSPACATASATPVPVKCTLTQTIAIMNKAGIH
jgi:type IV pilus assembly protein PilW